MSEVSVAQLEAQQKNHRVTKDRADALRRLLANADFKSVIYEGFMTKECARYVQESCDPLLDAGMRADALNLAQAAGHLKRWIQIQLQMAQVAERELNALEEAIPEARAFESWREANPDADENEFYGKGG